MGGTSRPGLDVVKRCFIRFKITSFFPEMAAKRSTFADGEKEADGRSRSSADAIPVVRKPSEKKHSSCLELVRSAIPCLLETAHKGQLGRIGVIGGCQE